MRKIRRRPETLSEIVNRKFYKNIDLNKLFMVEYVWNNEVKEYSKYCKIFAVEKRNLVLKAKNSVIKNEIFIKKDDILKKINKHFKTRFIRDIKFC
jgi:hypothetical protein